MRLTDALSAARQVMRTIFDIVSPRRIGRAVWREGRRPAPIRIDTTCDEMSAEIPPSRAVCQDVPGKFGRLGH